MQGGTAEGESEDARNGIPLLKPKVEALVFPFVDSACVIFELP